MEKDHLLSNQTYDLLKRLNTLALPALATFYFTLTQITGLPYGEQVVAICAALATLNGVLLEIAGKSYSQSDSKYDGVIDVTGEPGAKNLMLMLDKPTADDLVGQKEVLFKVNS